MRQENDFETDDNSAVEYLSSRRWDLLESLTVITRVIAFPMPIDLLEGHPPNVDEPVLNLGMLDYATHKQPYLAPGPTRMELQK